MSKFRRFILPLIGCLSFLLLIRFAQGQNRTLTGTVKNSDGTPLVGASVQVKGTPIGTYSNKTGHFSLSIPPSVSKIDISYLGYQPQEVNIKGKTNITVILHRSGTKLNELVVVGYGKQKREDLTGAISSISGKSLKDLPGTNLTAALQGKASGVQIINSSGQPGASPTIIIRGLSSLHQPLPLYIVDGVRVPASIVGHINIQDIASINVLKDASAAAIYGSGAAGGVVIITTKKGKIGKPSVSFSARYGVTKPLLIHLLDKQGYIKLQNIVHPQYFKGAAQLDTLANTDWVNALYRNGSAQNYNLSVSGASPTINYLFSGFYNNQQGVYIDNYSNIGGVRINTDYQLNDFIKIGEQLALSQRKSAPTVPNRTDLSYHNAPFRTMPIIPIHNQQGGWGTVPTGYNGLAFSGPNLMGAVKTAHTINFKNNLQSNVYANIKLPFHLSFKANLSYAYYHEKQNYFQDKFDYGSVQQGNNSLNKYSIESTQLLTNYLLSYNQNFGKSHIDALIGYEQIVSKYNNINATETAVGLPNFSFIQTSGSSAYVSGKYDPNGLIKSFFGRINYNYDQRYLLSASLRQDANYTVFGPNKQKGIFGAVSAGWNISREHFFTALRPVINLLKLRGSYGTLGNSNIGSYTFLATYSQFSGTGGKAIGAQNFSPNGPLVIANSINAVPNPNLHWETDYETDIGLDAEAFKGKLSLSIDWYDRVTKNMLYALPMALSSGYTSPYFVNIGRVTSKGLDISIGYKDHAGKFGYDVSVNGSFNKNVVNNLSGITNDALYDGYNYYNINDAGFSIMSNQPITITKAGLPFGSFYGYKAIGMFKTDAQAAKSAQPKAHAGDLIFKDKNEDGKITPKDREVIGNPNPKFVYGVNIRLTYGPFDIAMLFNGVAGVQLFNGVKAYEMYLFQDGNSTNKVFNDSYLGNNKLTGQPRLGVVNPDGSFTLDPNGNYTTVNSYFVENGSYLKLNNLQIGYSFSNNLLKKLKINSARIYIMANNLFTITKYTGLDPEIGSSFSAASLSGYVGKSVGVTTRGIDIVPQYPHTRIYSVGFDINF